MLLSKRNIFSHLNFKIGFKSDRNFFFYLSIRFLKINFLEIIYILNKKSQINA